MAIRVDVSTGTVVCTEDYALFANIRSFLMPDLDPNLQSLMIIGGLGVVCWLMIRSRMKNMKSSNTVVIPKLKFNANATGQPETFSGTQSLGAPKEVLRWQIELHDLGRELKGELDSKMIAIQALTQSSDQAALRLSELIQMAENLRFGPESPIAKVRQLAAQNWTSEKIAAQTGLSANEVQSLLAVAPTTLLPSSPTPALHEQD